MVTIFLIDDLIQYLNDQFESDARLPTSKKPMGYSAYNQEKIKDRTKTYFVVQCLDNMPKDETFIKVETLRMGIQIDIFALKGEFDGKQYLAQEMAMILQDLVSAYMEELKYGGANQNIRLMRKIVGTPSMPFEQGTKAYYSSLRYDLTITSNYEKVYD